MALNRTVAKRATNDMVRLCRAGMAPLVFAEAFLSRLQSLVPFDSCCFATTDPSTMLITGGLVADLPEDRSHIFFEHEYLDDPPYSFQNIARRTPPVAILGRDLPSSHAAPNAYGELLWGLGIRGELRASFVIERQVWGVLGIYRNEGQPDFSPDESAFIGGLSAPVALALRIGLLIASAPGQQDEVGGMVLLDSSYNLVGMTPAAQTWLDDLPKGEGSTAVPQPVQAVAARARRTGPPPRIRIKTNSGRWILIHAAPMIGEPEGRTAVFFEAARPAEIAPILGQAYGLTAREQEVMRMVVSGASSQEIADTLVVSPYTVQDHLKAIFDKVGVRSRRDLVGKVLGEQYFPRLLAGHGTGPSGWFLERA